ncbi:glutamate synthase-related protein [Chloroflexota bacterium]
MAQSNYHRYHIQTERVPDIAPWPGRFRPTPKRLRLAIHILKEIIRYRTNIKIIFSRPCIYGVYGRPVGGMAPRYDDCVGCLRCTTEHPDWVQVHYNPKFQRLGDSYLTADHADAIHYESQTGRVPVKGAGYRGKFGGDGWDGMWTDMSEIVRPTRDGIHGREFISTVVDIGRKPLFISFDERGIPDDNDLRITSIPLPILLDVPPASVASSRLFNIIAQAARETETLAIIPVTAIKEFGFQADHIVPLVTKKGQEELFEINYRPRMIELADWDEELYAAIQSRFPGSIICLRLPLDNQFQERLLEYYHSGVRVFHLTADYHGRNAGGEFILELIRKAHQTFVDIGMRDEVTLLGSGGIIAAEHVPKAIICGLDAVALDIAIPVALQAKMIGECTDRDTCQLRFPREIPVAWGVQRVKNLLASWRDQMLEILGAMGLREVRRLRGEMGRAMFQKELEKEAFREVTGYVSK